VIRVKLFKFLTDWYHANKQKHLDKMREQGKCPICRGKGFAIITSPYVGNTVDCYLCNGTGLFTEWEKNNID
jgi:DnaJ-class molecular chaperone